MKFLKMSSLLLMLALLAACGPASDDPLPTQAQLPTLTALPDTEVPSQTPFPSDTPVPSATPEVTLEASATLGSAEFTDSGTAGATQEVPNILTAVRAQQTTTSVPLGTRLAALPTAEVIVVVGTITTASNSAGEFLVVEGAAGDRYRLDLDVSAAAFYRNQRVAVRGVLTTDERGTVLDVRSVDDPLTLTGTPDPGLFLTQAAAASTPGFEISIVGGGNANPFAALTTPEAGDFTLTAPGPFTALAAFDALATARPDVTSEQWLIVGGNRDGWTIGVLVPDEEVARQFTFYPDGRVLIDDQPLLFAVYRDAPRLQRAAIAVDSPAALENTPLANTEALLVLEPNDEGDPVWRVSIADEIYRVDARSGQRIE